LGVLEHDGVRRRLDLAARHIAIGVMGELDLLI
jgi:hypothetical protein